MEITMKNLLETGQLDHQDFLARADMLAAAGKTVLISDYFQYYRLVGYLQRYTTKPVGIALGAGSLLAFLDEKYYSALESSLAGGILEAVGRTFRQDTRFFVYPLKNPETGSLTTVENREVSMHLSKLYGYLVDRGCILSLRGYNPDYLRIFSRDVARRIKEGDASWEQDVPPEIAALIKKRGFFGYRRESA